MAVGILAVYFEIPNYADEQLDKHNVNYLFNIALTRPKLVSKVSFKSFFFSFFFRKLIFLSALIKVSRRYINLDFKSLIFHGAHFKITNTIEYQSVSVMILVGFQGRSEKCLENGLSFSFFLGNETMNNKSAKAFSVNKQV